MSKMTKIVKQHSELCDAVNKLGEYIQTIDALPPTGAGARVQVCNEITIVCETIIRKTQSCSTLLVEKIYDMEGKA